MPKVKGYSNEAGERIGYTLFCPGCKFRHLIFTTGRVQWSFNGDVERPTFTPSLKITGVEPTTDEDIDRIMAGEMIEPKKFCCHSHITDGRIQFCDDCTHELKGQIVPLEDIEKWE